MLFSLIQGPHTRLFGPWSVIQGREWAGARRKSRRETREPFSCDSRFLEPTANQSCKNVARHAAPYIYIHISFCSRVSSNLTWDTISVKDNTRRNSPDRKVFVKDTTVPQRAGEISCDTAQSCIRCNQTFVNYLIRL